MADEQAPEPKPKATRRDKAALPFSEDTDKLDGRAWNQKPLLVIGAILLIVAVVVAILLAGKNLTEGDDGEPVDVPPPVSSTTTTAPSTTTTTTTSTTAPPTTELTGPRPGDRCDPADGDPDCIDPEGDGSHNLIVGGADCLATADDPLQCADNDGDGDAGPASVPT